MLAKGPQEITVPEQADEDGHWIAGGKLRLLGEGGRRQGTRKDADERRGREWRTTLGKRSLGWSCTRTVETEATSYADFEEGTEGV